jgi:hypothetical protein
MSERYIYDPEHILRQQYHLSTDHFLDENNLSYDGMTYKIIIGFYQRNIGNEKPIQGDIMLVTK